MLIFMVVFVHVYGFYYDCDYGNTDGVGAAGVVGSDDGRRVGDIFGGASGGLGGHFYGVAGGCNVGDVYAADDCGVEGGGCFNQWQCCSRRFFVAIAFVIPLLLLCYSMLI